MTTNKEYSMNYHAVKAREYNKDPFNYAISKMRITAFIKNKYNSEDEERRMLFRAQRAVINKNYYLKRKEKLAKEAEMKV
jgi:hypothetical protein